MHIMEGMEELGKSKEVMIWLRLSCDFMIYEEHFLMTCSLNGFFPDGAADACVTKCGEKFRELLPLKHGCTGGCDDLAPV
jgi:hypothetical protein